MMLISYSKQSVKTESHTVTHTQRHTHMHTNPNTNTLTLTDTHTHSYTHTQTHSHKHTHKHTPNPNTDSISDFLDELQLIFNQQDVLFRNMWDSTFIVRNPPTLLHMQCYIDTTWGLEELGIAACVFFYQSVSWWRTLFSLSLNTPASKSPL